MLRVQRLAEGKIVISSPETVAKSIEVIGNTLRSVEPQEEGVRMELLLKFEGQGSSGEIISRIKDAFVNPANSLLKASGVDPWPENKEVIFQDGTAVRIRWYKNFAWAAVIWDILKGLLIALAVIGIVLVIIWAVNKYIPGAKGYIWAIVAGISILMFGPAIVSMLRERTEGYYA